MTKKPFYITTTLPYVNADPHIGFAMELIRADIVARSEALMGHEVFFNTGTDEHGVKIYRKAKEQNQDVQAYVDSYAKKFKDLIPLLGIQESINFVRTTDEHHIKAAQEFWKIVKKNGYIYKKNYSVKYCVGCELEKTESELVDGRCPLHPLSELEIINEENYFFKFSAFQDKLLTLYKKNPDFVIPSYRMNEIVSFVEQGLEDFSISRLKSKMPWGIEVPDDKDHVMYVWFDALVNYISAVGWPDDEIRGKKVKDSFKKWWVRSGGVVQYCGKDNLRQQSAMWQAMLMACDISPSKTIVIDGFITGEGGVKMSKSLGNTVDPLDIVKDYGTDALRFFVVHELHPFEDSPFTKEKFKESYNAYLANGLGNLVSRVLKMATANDVKFDEKVALKFAKSSSAKEAHKVHMESLEKYDLQKGIVAVWDIITKADQFVQEKQPFKTIKTNPKEAKKDIQELLARLDFIASMLLPFLPSTSTYITDLVRNNKMPDKPLFLRK